MHCYLYVRCKTPNCPAKLNLSHFEMPMADDSFTFVDYPDKDFPVTLPGGACGQTYTYGAKEVQTESVREPHHPPEWRPILPAPPLKLPGSN
jgi:hypothetical protein